MIATESRTLRKSDYQISLQKGISYHQYKQRMMEDWLQTSDEKLKDYININLHRINRIEKTYEVDERIKQLVSHIHHKVYWLILSEHWCGDAAQNLPAINKIAELSNGKIELKIVYRDENKELMDAHLTDGSRSIPKLIQLDGNLNITGIWGPRPSTAQALVRALKSNPETASTYSNQLHKWYAQDKNKSLEIEMLKLIAQSNLFCHDCLN